MSIDLSKLKALAELANDDTLRIDIEAQANDMFLAAVNPAVLLELIARVEALEEAHADWQPLRDYVREQQVGLLGDHYGTVAIAHMKVLKARVERAEAALQRILDEQPYSDTLDPYRRGRNGELEWCQAIAREALAALDTSPQS